MRLVAVAPFSLTRFQLNVLLTLLLVSLYNQPLWSSLVQHVPTWHVRATVFAMTLALLMSAMIFTLLSLATLLGLQKVMGTLLLIGSSALLYFNRMGIVIDESMLNNILQTDYHEASELASIHLVLFMLAAAALPLYFYWRTSIVKNTLAKGIGFHVLVIVGLLFASVSLFYSQYQYSVYFARENRDLRMLINPLFTMGVVEKHIRHGLRPDPEFKVIGQDALQHKMSNARTVGIVIMGETARVDHFSINGYEKNTTPHLLTRLQRGDLINFGSVDACGTSTAYSVPCVFSMLAAEGYSPESAQWQSNVLDILEYAGVKTFWRDNNSSCKGVCKRIANENLRENISESSPFYHEGEYLDEALLANLDLTIDQTGNDMLIVLHPLGSHGPAYHRRYPESFSKFQPACASNSPQDCSSEEVANSYDNTLLYTDYLVDKTIALLEKRHDLKNTFVLYLSDHGESLGENGVYLHGVPKAIAPDSQLKVPMLMWMSEGMRAQSEDSVATADCAVSVSHDNVSHTLLSLFSVESAVLDPDLAINPSLCDHNSRLAKQP